MDARVKLRALGLSEDRIIELIGNPEGGSLDRTTREIFSDAPATYATTATNEQGEGLAVLAWATSLVEGAVSYSGPIPLSFHESSLVPVRVDDPIQYARRRLQSLSYAKTMAGTGGLERWDREFWQQTIERGLAALTAMREATESRA